MYQLHRIRFRKHSGTRKNRNTVRKWGVQLTRLDTSLICTPVTDTSILNLIANNNILKIAITDGQVVKN